MTHTCPVCQEEKPLNLFPRVKYKGEFKPRLNRCRQCCSDAERINQVCRKNRKWSRLLAFPAPQGVRT